MACQWAVGSGAYFGDLHFASLLLFRRFPSSRPTSARSNMADIIQLRVSSAPCMLQPRHEIFPRNYCDVTNERL